MDVSTAGQDQARPGWLRGVCWSAIALNGFAIVTVNYWIYRALIEFTARHSETYFRPATISRAISDPLIGEPFALWITVSGICFALGVALLLVYYLRMTGAIAGAVGWYLWLSFWGVLPVLGAMQMLSGLGMYWLSTFRFPDANEMHMMGSYVFFGSQAVVVLLFTVFNHALLRDKAALALLDEQGWVRARMVLARFWFGVFCLLLTVVYGALFTLKDVYPEAVAPTLYWSYTRTEPALITAFLLLLAIGHLDILRRR